MCKITNQTNKQKLRKISRWCIRRLEFLIITVLTIFGIWLSLFFLKMATQDQVSIPDPITTIEKVKTVIPVLRAEDFDLNKEDL